jgi:histidinol phosphatase-like PHP family hydrolase
MARPNKEVEALLQEYADLVSITGTDAYRARAYEKAARAIGGYPTDVSRLDAKHLREIPNVGKSIADKVEEYLHTGQMAAVEDARAKIPAGVRELIAIPTLGPKKAISLYEELHISSVDELADAIQAQKLRELKGFGPKTEENILHGITLMQSAGGRVQIGVAMELAEDVVAAMKQVVGGRGYAYYAITDHAPDLYMQQMTDEKILRQRDAVQQLDGTHKRMRLLHGTELNIGPEGDVDWPQEFLTGFDLCVASLHSHFNQGRDALTRRLIRACEHPYVNIIGHPTTRYIGRRPPADIDIDAVFAACARTGTALEINGQPERLDLSDENIMRAKRHGVKFAIDSDAHSTLHLDYLRYGVGTAQRAWLAADDVINTWPLGRLRQFLRKDRLREGRTSRLTGGKE